MTRAAGAFLAMIILARVGQGQQFHTALPEVGADPIVFLSENNLTASFSTSNLWLATIHFPANGTNAASDLQILGPIVSIFIPIDGVGGGESIIYNGDFVVTDNQKQMLLANQAQMILTQDLISIDPMFQPEVVAGTLLDYVTVPLAAPRIVRPGNLRLNWQSQTGLAYQVQFRSLIDPTAWINMELTIIATSNTIAVDVPIVGISRFYRLIQVP